MPENVAFDDVEPYEVSIPKDRGRAPCFKVSAIASSTGSPNSQANGH